MTTLRESLQAEISLAKTDLAEKEARLAKFETTFSDALSRDVGELETFFRSVGRHLFGRPAPASGTNA